MNIPEWFANLQTNICTGLENLDGGAKFITDEWTRPEGGGGATKIIQNGNALIKGGVAFSKVDGACSDNMLRVLQVKPATPTDTLHFLATGVSIVIHPISPEVPIIHMNVRYFELSDGTWWFGGGIDLTPHFVNLEFAKKFHLGLKKACDAHDPTFYPKFKTWADDYFFLSHRKETRGVGGIFFDRLNTESCGLSKAQIFEFVKAVGESFVPLYAEQVNAFRNLPYDEEALAWQGLRRGRYVEFNLIWDRGTHFGLQTNGRTESILMSLPPVSNWAYNYQPAAGSRAEMSQQFLVKGIDWVNMAV